MTGARAGAPRFSAIVVARDEEAFIRPCLEHLQWCDERILVDMQSVDQTRARAADLVTAIVDQPPRLAWALGRRALGRLWRARRAGPFSDDEAR